MKLEEFFPPHAEFTLSSRARTYTLRVPNLEDRSKFREWTGSDAAIQRVFDEMQWDVIAKFVYRLLIEKSEFLGERVVEIDDDGIEKTYLLTGPAVLMRACLTLDEAMGMLRALVRAIRNGDPLIDKAMSEMTTDEIKKKETSLKKKLTGQKSSTSSPPSTAMTSNSLES